MGLLEVVRSAHVHSLWEGSFCPQFLFLHLTSFLSQCAQACTAALVGGITHSISQPKKCILNMRSQLKWQRTELFFFMQGTLSAISAKGKIDWTSDIEMK